MPRPHKKPVQILAGSRALICAMLCVRADDLEPGILSGAIPVFMCGIRRRIFVGDAVEYLRTKPRYIPKKKRTAS